jgi:hypothetical protein
MNGHKYSGEGDSVWADFLEFNTLIATLFMAYPVFAPLFKNATDKITASMNNALYTVLLFSTKDTARKIVLQHAGLGRNALDALRSALQTLSIGDCCATVTTLFSFKILPTESPTLFFTRYRNIFVALSEYDMPDFTDTFKISVLLNALPSLYAPLVSHFSYQSDAIDISQLESTCLSFYKNNYVPDVSNNNSAFYSFDKKTTHLQKIKWRNTNCSRCGIKGHDNDPPGQCTARLCGHCHKGGHSTDACPNEPEDKTQFVTDTMFYISEDNMGIF